jgi:hypothetical protein
MHSYVDKKIYSCKKWVLQQVGQTTTSSSSNSFPIYLADASRAWLNRLPRNSIDCWEDLEDIFTGNF